MTEKRFTLKYIDEQHISANLYDNGTFIGSTSIGEELIIELLNNLSKENEQLKQEIKTLEEKIEFVADAMIVFEQFFYTKVYSGSDKIDDDALCELSNILFNIEDCDDFKSKKN